MPRNRKLSQNPHAFAFAEQCKKFEKRVSALRKENEDFSVREQRLKQEVGELKKKMKAARKEKGEPAARAANQAKRLQDQVDRLQKQVRKFENEQRNAAKTKRISAAATREPLEDMENRQPTKTSSTW
jgi:predicted nuclease with TOPRIM domain